MSLEPRQLCIIEPKGEASAEVYEQLGGLIVHTSERTPCGKWYVRKPAVVVYRTRNRDSSGAWAEVGVPYEMAVPEDWLRPIHGVRCKEDFADRAVYVPQLKSAVTR